MANYGRNTQISWTYTKSNGQRSTTTLRLVDVAGYTATTETVPMTRYGDCVRRHGPGHVELGGITLLLSTEDPTHIVELEASQDLRAVGSLTILYPALVQRTYTAVIVSLSHQLSKTDLYTVSVTFKFTGDRSETSVISDYTIYPPPIVVSPLMCGGTYGFSLRLAGGGAANRSSAVQWTVDRTSIPPKPKTMFRGSTLTIDPTEVAAPIIVRARVDAQTEVQETYDVQRPHPVVMSISGPAYVEARAGTEANIGNYKTLVIPVAASAEAVWMMRPASDHISLNALKDYATLVVTEGISPEDSGRYTIYATSTATPGLTAAISFALRVTDPENKK